MSLYSKRGGSLKSIKEKPFKLEKDLQKLTEENLEELFGLEFVSTEMPVAGLYIDTLAFNSKTQSFVIIEYKKERNISVIDQGFSYLSLMLNNKSDFILEYNEKKGKNLKRGDVDWSQARVSFISPIFTAHQQNAINFRDLPLELWQVSQYENDLVSYQRIKVDGSSESIRTLSKDKQINAVAKEVKSYTEEDVIGRDKKVNQLYSGLKEKISLIDSSLYPNPTKSYIGFQMPDNWRVLFSARKSWRNSAEGKGLVISFNRSQPSDYKDIGKKMEYIKYSKKHYNQHLSRMYVMNEEDLEYAYLLLKQAYEKFMKEYYSKG